MNDGRPVLARLAHVTVRHRWAVIGGWLFLTLFGAFAAGQVSSRWFQSTSVPGQPAHEASQRSVQALNVGARAPNVVVFHTSDDVTKTPAIEQAMQRAAATVPGAFTSSYFSTGSLLYVSNDRHTAFEEIYGPGRGGGRAERCVRDPSSRGERPAGDDRRQRDRSRRAG